MQTSGHVLNKLWKLYFHDGFLVKCYIFRPYHCFSLLARCCPSVWYENRPWKLQYLYILLDNILTCTILYCLFAILDQAETTAEIAMHLVKAEWEPFMHGVVYFSIFVGIPASFVNSLLKVIYKYCSLNWSVSKWPCKIIVFWLTLFFMYIFQYETTMLSLCFRDRLTRHVNDMVLIHTWFKYCI